MEDPERKPAALAGFRGARYLSAEASARGKRAPGSAKSPGLDAYATSKQGNLATALAFARAFPRLRVNAIERSFNMTTGLGRDVNAVVRLIAKYLFAALAPLIPYGITSERAGRVIAEAVLNKDGATGVYYDERGRPMQGSTRVRDPDFKDRVVRETRELLARG